MTMNNESSHSTTLVATDPYVDPVSYLAEFGIEAELVGIADNSLPEAA